MKIGICWGADPETLAHIKELQYDYIEANFAALATMPDAAFTDAARVFAQSGLPIYSYNCFLMGGLSCYDDHAERTLDTYLKNAFPRMKMLGGDVVVFGSGGARSIPDGMDPATAEEKFLRVLRLSAEYADKSGMKIAIEPLSRNECNYINTVADAAHIAALSGCPNVGALVDFYHFDRNGETDDGLLPAGKALIHAHVARVPDRRVPRVEDTEAIRRWARMLRDVGYTGNISLECIYDGDPMPHIRATRPVIELFRSV